MELGTERCGRERSRLMARDTHVYAIGYVAKMIGENVELLEQIAANRRQDAAYR